MEDASLNGCMFHFGLCPLHCTEAILSGRFWGYPTLSDSRGNPLKEDPGAYFWAVATEICFLFSSKESHFDSYFFKGVEITN